MPPIMPGIATSAPAAPAGTAAVPSGAGSAAEKTAREFEAVFIGQMTQLMMESVEPGEFSGGHAEQMFRGILAEKLGTAIADRGGLGLAPAVLQQIIMLQEGATHDR